MAKGDESFDVAQDRESIDVAQDREPVERPVERLVERLVEPFGICYFLTADARSLKPQALSYNILLKNGLRPNPASNNSANKTRK